MRVFLSLCTLMIGLVAGMPGARADDWTIVTRFQVNPSYGDPYRWTRFDRPMNAIRLTAVGGRVQCRRVVATYGDGTRQQIFEGVIQDRQSRLISFNAYRRMNALSFVCRTDRARGVRVRVEGQVASLDRGRGTPPPDVQDRRRDTVDERRLRQERFRADRGPDYFGNDFTRIGLVQFGPRLEREIEYTRFPGRLSALRLRARGSAVRCQRVVATYRNGSSQQIFRGIIREGATQQVSFNRDRRVAALTFVCQSERGQQAGLVISGRYERDARPGAGNRLAWRRLGAARFERRGSVERVFSRFDGPIQRIGLRPIDDNARCGRIAVTFANGRTRELPFSNSILEEDRLYTFDLPGDQRRVERIALACRAFRARDVTIAIYGISVRDRADGRRSDVDRRTDRFRVDRTVRSFGPDWTRVGRVEFGPRLERELRYTDFPTPVSSVRLRARGSAIRCRSVSAAFGNGNRREVFSGVIREGESRIISFRRDRRVDALTFVCQSERNQAGVLIISGKDDNGRRDDRARSGARGADWVRLGQARFRSRNEVERTFARFDGPVRRLGLRPLDDDARCSRILVTFANGRSRELPFGRGVLQEDRMYTVDLPGDQRRIRAVTMVCRAVRARDATIAIFGIR